MTVAQLEASMTVDEENGWIEYHALLRKDHDAAMKRGGKPPGKPTKPKKK